MNEMEMTNERALSEFHRKFEEMEQEKLANHMIINGVQTEQVDRNKNDMTRFTTSIFANFNITVDANEIEQAYSFEVATGRRRIVVIFKSLSKKLAVMAAKRKCANAEKIYFDHRTTAAYGEILRKLREFSKENGGKSFIYGNRVYYQKDQQPKVRVNSVAEIEKLRDIPQ
jgi:hypothetical protein